MVDEEIKKKIIRYLEAQKYPATTEEIAKCVDISWNTAELYLVRLQMAGKVLFKRAGRQNQWWPAKKDITILDAFHEIPRFGSGNL